MELWTYKNGKRDGIILEGKRREYAKEKYPFHLTC